jgi:hypothetical protein
MPWNAHPPLRVAPPPETVEVPGGAGVGDEGRSATWKAFAYSPKALMSPKAQELLEQLRALPPQERLRVVEQVMNEVEDANPAADSSAEIALWARANPFALPSFLTLAPAPWSASASARWPR